VKLLEREVGMRLVEPDGRRIRITEAGRALAARAAPLLAEISALPHAVHDDAARSASVLRLGSHEVFATYVLSHLVHQLEIRFGLRPRIEHRYLIPGQIENLVRDEHVDVGMTYHPVPTAGVVHLPVAEAPMGIFGHPAMAKHAPAEWRFAAPLRPVVGSPTRGQGLDGWPDDRVHRTVSFAITNTESALELCRRGFAVAYFPKFLVGLHNEVTAPRNRLVRLPDPPGLGAHSEHIHLAVRVGDERAAHVDELAKILAALVMDA
jgi:DNA-binding transcriptional LysR family regulator